MSAIILLLISVALAFAQPPAQTAEVTAPSAVKSTPGILPEGTPVRMRINRTVSSADTHSSDNVDFETLDDVKLGPLVVIPNGSTAMARPFLSDEWHVGASST